MRCSFSASADELRLFEINCDVIMAIEDSNCWYRQNFAFLMYSCIGSEAIDLCPVYSRIDHSLFCRDFNCIWDNLFVR